MTSLYIWLITVLFDIKWIKHIGNILISQSCPLKPFGQMQVYEAIPSSHVPPLLHGVSIQSSMSEMYQMNSLPNDASSYRQWLISDP